MADKISPKKRADIAILKAAGYSNVDIGNKLDIAESTVRYHLKKIREEAEKIGPYRAVLRIIMEAGPDYGFFRLSPLGISPQEIFKELECEECEER